MQVGKKVVCVNDVFSEIIRVLYRELPVEGVVYTVRETSLGRDQVGVPGHKLGDGAASEASVTVRILLHELHNDPDPTHKHGQELGFNAERFREIEEVSDESVRVAELVEAN